MSSDKWSFVVCSFHRGGAALRREIGSERAEGARRAMPGDPTEIAFRAA